jgi:hypothetical protein
MSVSCRDFKDVAHCDLGAFVHRVTLTFGDGFGLQKEDARMIWINDAGIRCVWRFESINVSPLLARQVIHFHFDDEKNALMFKLRWEK